MKPIKLIIRTKTKKYPILVGSNLVSKLSNIFNHNSIKFEKCLLLIDKNVPKLMIKKIAKSINDKKIFIYFLEASERNKNQNTANSILEKLLIKNFTRNDCLISIGGGITGDIGSFVSSLFKRGIKFINIPTTLLAQVDSSLGGKTGVNTKFGKNLIGTFYQPELVISDVNFLKTLSQRQIICGYGEILKHSLIANKNFFYYLNKYFSNIISLKSPFIEKSIYESCKIKKSIVEKDEKENNLRKVLNFGHTFAHAYEASLNYSKKLNHGEAVLLGMSTALKFSDENRIIKKKDYIMIKKKFINSNLPIDIKQYFSSKDIGKIVSFMIKDKKNNSENINLVLLKKIGKPIIDKRYNKNKLKLFLKKELNN
tara:strand:- start:324 stop:1430 length:1107 start_codon:yes stop_codon:yes gene_type:complete